MEQDYKNNYTTIREQNNSNNTLWYVIFAIVILAILIWFGFSKGWFSPRSDTNQIIIDNIDQTQTPVDTMAAQVDDFTIQVLESFPVQVLVRANGNLSDGCSILQEPVSFRDGNVFYINLDVIREGEVCTQALVPYEVSIPLQVTNLPAGVYIVNVNGQEKTFELTMSNEIDFQAGVDK